MTIVIPPVPPPEVMTLPVTPDPNTYTLSRNHHLPPTPPYTPEQPKRESVSLSESESKSAGTSHGDTFDTFDSFRRVSLESDVSEGATSGSADTSATSLGSYPYPGNWSSVTQAQVTHRRLLSDNELSYYLPSRADGVNDMYLHHTLVAPIRAMSFTRILHIWAYQLVRHPLLAARIQMNDYENVSFVQHPPTSVDQAIKLASERFRLSRVHDTLSGSGGGSGTDADAEATSTSPMILSYLNGPRTLSNDLLSCLFFGTPNPFTPDASPGMEEQKATYEFMLCSTHFLGDGMALHTFMNEFYTLVGSESSTKDIAGLIYSAISEQRDRSLPKSLEERMPNVGDGGKLAKAVGKEEYLRSEARLMGDQVFAKNSTKRERRTIVPTFAYSAEETKKILANCKANGVTIAHAMFALCNIAWSRRASSTVAPCMIYSALNLRPNMLPSSDADASSSYFHLAVGYFNIVLPCLLPSTLTTDDLFWYRARMTKAQTIKAVKTPFLISRSRETNNVRRGRAVKWAKVDDEAAAAAAAPAQAETGEKASSVTQNPGPESSPAASEQDLKKPEEPTWKPAPQRALMGMSMLGNLDGMYSHKNFPSLQLQSLTTGSRQRSGGLLLFAYTFAGKLWMSLGYDANGFAPGEIEGFWKEVRDLAGEVLL